MTRLGLHSLAITPLWNPQEAEGYFPKLKALGISAFEVPLLDPATFDSAGTKAVFEKHGLTPICSLGLPGTIDVTERTEEAMDFLDAVVRAARASGADMLGGVTYGTIGRVSGRPPQAREYDAICRLIGHVAGTARSLGMRLGLEPCNRYETHLLNTARQTADLIERIGADNLFIHLDTYHMNIEEKGLGNGFRDAGRHLGYVHLSESNRGVPGAGTIDWDDVFASLKALGYGGIMTLESFVHVAPELAGGLAVWRPVAENPDDVVDKGVPYLTEAARRAGLDMERP
ncbi:sugar phosphate isomerase/epimerase [Nitratireductor sp. ZSWI3]|uniref:sugar phosphate isomerase/epimerase family protein n=1 Tax=Nitratireductor sp. ZSWI3 TaxID=2966359 RepID=UPI00214FD506|nr:sugar phosphate isomerase/epimerase family protein [Nitratireductor sp. ZSWI3]MCR4267200.1 sugar phosphate isomerase/epimerase [Nitratireductor sp. ZSWI3]